MCLIDAGDRIEVIVYVISYESLHSTGGCSRKFVGTGPWNVSMGNVDAVNIVCCVGAGYVCSTPKTANEINQSIN